MAALAALVPVITSAVTSAGTAAAAAAGTAGSFMASAAPVLSALGTAATVGGTLAAGASAKSQGEFMAAQAKRQGAEKLAVASREAEEQQRKNRQVMSMFRSRAAASGSDVGRSASDLAIAEDIGGRGEFLTLSRIFEGLSAQDGAKDQAKMYRDEGNAKRTASFLDAVGAFSKGTYDLGKDRGWFVAG